MRLRAGQLVSHLNKSGLAPVYLLCGDEPLQLMECADEIRLQAKRENFEERLVFDTEKDFEWKKLQEETANMSLFSSRRVIELRMMNAKPGNEGSATLVQYTESPPPDNVLIVTTGKLDRNTQQSKWFKALDKHGVVVQVWPIDTGQMPVWIQQRVKQQGKTISLVAAGIIAERVEGNLLAAKQEIEKLCLLISKPEIREEDILAAVTDSARFDIFEMLSTAQYGQSERALHMLHGLREEGVDAGKIYGALMWEFRQICSMAYLYSTGVSIEKIFAEYRVWEMKRKPYRMVLERFSLPAIHRLLQYAIHIDHKIKSSDRDMVWDQLQTFLSALSGKPVMQLHENFTYRVAV